ncbi:MAG: NAD-dependent DNA ligase LigA [Lachnospiraceae bacterium]|jgi:DNA ligase (NAD+)|nr:NAD-dependent DNA ligase LigA [Lachnospiraceae bacterium]
MNKKQRITELVEKLNLARKAYYMDAVEVMPNLEYDKLYDELEALEKETGIIMANSPTINVGYEVVSSLPKERHPSPMLSLDKTKSVDTLASFVGKEKSLLSWKMDGLTIVLTYREGKLYKAVTRGNGEVGEVVTANAKTFKNIPISIPFKGELIIRGEAIITYSDFEKINEEIPDIDSKYKNPRNLVSGSVRQLNSEITANRNVGFYAFSFVSAKEMDGANVTDNDASTFDNSHEEQFIWLKNLGFQVVEYHIVTEENVEEQVLWFKEQVKKNDFPSDGLVVLYDDIAYGKSLGSTSKFPKDSIAFKWADEKAMTKLIEIEWNASRTGLINPIAVFEPVELEGTTVKRASLHNISILEELELGVGDEISVYKANMIIPQIAENFTKSANAIIPEECPACGTKTIIKEDGLSKTLNCPNPNCPAKQIKKFTLFVSRDALNVDGLSESTLEKFIDRGFVKNYIDVFHLQNHEDEIVEMEGFGRKSYDNLILSVDKARHVALPKLIYALGILGIGLANAKLICKYFNYDLDKIISANVSELEEIDGLGTILATSFAEYFSSEENMEIFNNLVKELDIEIPVVDENNQRFAGVNFVITGDVVHFANRNEVKELIESMGGKVTGSVTSKTNYLINNDVNSSSSKNKKAKSLGIPIISEDEFIEMSK